MKNKKFTYILFPLVLFIWGFIFYKILFQLKSTENDQSVSLLKMDTVFAKAEVDTFVLDVNYPDPFLRGRTTTQNKTSAKMINRITQNPLPKEEIRWPKITYRGLVTNVQNKNGLGLLTIDGKNIIINTDEILNGLTIRLLYEDSIVIEFNQVKKVFYKSPQSKKI